METRKKMVIVITQGHENERSSVAWSIANGAINSGLDLSIFLTSSAVDWVRKGGAERARSNPEDPTIKEVIQKVVDNGCQIAVCPPCAKVRNYEADDLVEGVTLVGSAFIHATGKGRCGSAELLKNRILTQKGCHLLGMVSLCFFQEQSFNDTALASP